MKKYSKPTMECELFVANEYVAGCTVWDVVSTNKDHSLNITVEVEPTATDTDNDGFYLSNGQWWYHVGLEPHKYGCFQINITERLKDMNHPNASV